MKKFYLFLLGFLAPISLLISQEFTCDGTFYISINQSGPPTTFYEITTAGGVNFMPLFNVDLNMNGTGLSTIDRNIYGVAFNTNEVFRVQADGTVESAYTETDILTWNAAAGAVNNNGVYVVHDRTLDMIFLYQTGASVTKLGSVELFWDASTGNTGIFDHNIDDLVFDPFDDGVMYTYQRFWDTSGPPATRGHLLKVNVDMSSPDFGMVSSVGELDPNVIVHLGSLFFDTNGSLHGYGAQSANPIIQDRLVKINQNNASIEELGQGPQATGVDGCSCRNPMQLTKQAEMVETTCDSNFIEFCIQIENLSMLETVELKLKDSLSFEGTITDIVADNFITSTITEGGIGTDHFIFEGFQLNGSSSATLCFQVATSLSDTIVENQARLYEIGLDSPIDSDDPSTEEISDPTKVYLPIISGDNTIFFDNRICEGESIEINGIFYDQSGDYIDTLVSVSGCDSIIVLSLDVVPNTIRNETINLCPGESFVINGETYDTPGNYTQMLTNVAGCDSTIFIEIFAIGCDDCLPEHSNILFNDITLLNRKDGLYDITFDYNENISTILGIPEIELLDILTNLYLSADEDIIKLFDSKTVTHKMLTDLDENKLSMNKYQDRSFKVNSVSSLITSLRSGGAIRLIR